jgi:hypothetical protein
MYLLAIPSNRMAAGHSGQYNTESTSLTRLYNMVRYSASFEFLIVFVFPDLTSGSITNIKSVLNVATFESKIK